VYQYCSSDCYDAIMIFWYCTSIDKTRYYCLYSSRLDRFTFLSCTSRLIEMDTTEIEITDDVSWVISKLLYRTIVINKDDVPPLCGASTCDHKRFCKIEWLDTDAVQYRTGTLSLCSVQQLIVLVVGSFYKAALTVPPNTWLWISFLSMNKYINPAL
jgi:hypothetical protein